jgi:glutamyl-Q tRNA(Asp) synthetase
MIRPPICDPGRISLMNSTTPYRGRFAPTPSGPLHLGSLVTALAGFLQARVAGGRWLLRIDDLDAPRCVPGAAAQIQRQLEDHALDWDESPRLQSAHVDEYREALERLLRSGTLYACTCTRAQLARDSLAGPDGPVYAGTCRGKQHTSGALRFRAGAGIERLDDGWQGILERDIARDIGDFTVRRADDQVGYQLACVVDEAAQGITEVVRGADLLGSTFRQRLLKRALGLAQPRVRHLPVLLDAGGRKLSKQNHAAPVESNGGSMNLVHCLRYLEQQTPVALERATTREVVDWAVANWRPSRVPALASLPANLVH